MNTLGGDILLLEDIQRLLDQALEPEPSVVISAGGVIREGYDERSTNYAVSLATPRAS